MQRHLELAYVAIQLADPASVDPFLADVVGLVPGEAAPDGITTWRNDDKAHRVIVEPGPANDAVAVGFEASDETALVTRRTAAASPAASHHRTAPTQGTWHVEYCYCRRQRRHSSGFASHYGRNDALQPDRNYTLRIDHS